MSNSPAYDQHVRTYNFVMNHEYQHMLGMWTMLRREAEARREAMQGKPRPTEAEYNLAQDYIINNILLK